MVRVCVVAFLTTRVISSRIESEHSRHIDIGHHAEKEGDTYTEFSAAARTAQVTCQQACNEWWLPDACPIPDFNYTTQTEIPLQSCPEPCQTYFTGVSDSCSVGDQFEDDGGTGLTMPTFAQYTLWDEFHSRYPTCNLGPTPPACQRAWNQERVPHECPSVEFNYTTNTYITSELCPEPCQTYFTGVLDTCSIGDEFQDAATYAQHTLWGTFYDRYPGCNLGYTVSACTAAMNAVADSIYSVCERSVNSPCTAECAALFETVKTNCAGSATYVPTCCEGSNTYSEQTWSLSRVRPFHFMGGYDETCIALLSADSSAAPAPAPAGSSASRFAPLFPVAVLALASLI